MFIAIRHTARLIGLLVGVLRYDLVFLLDGLPLPSSLLGLLRRFRHHRAQDRPGERLARMLERQGPSFIKLGQSIATRGDLLGEDVARDLTRLQDELPPFDSATAQAIIEAELEQPIARLFRRFEPQPVAAASLAQVHFAETHRGERVAVKVLRPNVAEQIERDLAFFAFIADVLNALGGREMQRLRPDKVVEVLAQTTRRELDLRLEAAAASELAENFKDEPFFRVPKIYWRLSGGRVLTLERLAGANSDEPDKLISMGLDPTEILKLSAEVFFKQVFRDGFFHADIHPGNVFIDAQGRMRPIDFGIMGRIDSDSRKIMARILVGFLRGDYQEVADAHFEGGLVPADQDKLAFQQAARAIGEPILGLPLNQISVGRLLGQLFATTRTFNMPTQPQLILLQKTMVVAEGVGRTLNPNVNMWQLAQPLIEEWIAANLGPAARVKDAARDTGRNVRRVLDLLPKLEAALEQTLNPPRPPVRVRFIGQSLLFVSGWVVAGVLLGMVLAG